MKNIFKVLGIAVLAAAVGFSMIACDDDGEKAVKKDALTAKITEAKGKVEADYTEASWTALKTALAAAEVVAANEEATQAEVDTATTALDNAIKGLERLVGPELPIIYEEGSYTAGAAYAKDDDDNDAIAFTEPLDISEYTKVIVVFSGPFAEKKIGPHGGDGGWGGGGGALLGPNAALEDDDPDYEEYDAVYYYGDSTDPEFDGDKDPSYAPVTNGDGTSYTLTFETKDLEKLSMIIYMTWFGYGSSGSWGGISDDDKALIILKSVTLE